MSCCDACGVVCAQKFGVVGDGVTDDTAAAQLALNYGALFNRVIYFGNLKVSISSGLTCSGPGIEFDQSDGTPGFYVTGSGYTALTVTGSPHCLKLRVLGTGNEANGVYLNNPQNSTGVAIYVYNLQGFGVKIDKCWDCLFDSFSVVSCGTASEWAFSMNDADDTCNMTHILHLQVELAQYQAIYISPNCQNCQIDVIHSERPTVYAAGSAPSGYATWLIGGNGTTYNVVLLSAIDDSDQSVAQLNLTLSTLNQLTVLGSASLAIFNCWQSGAATQCTTFNACLIEGDSYTTGNGTVLFFGCTFLGTLYAKVSVSGITPSGGRAAYYQCELAGLTVGDGGSIHDVTAQQIYDSNVASLNYASGVSTAAATFVNSTVGVDSLLSNQIFRSCTIKANSGTLPVYFNTILMADCSLDGTLALAAAIGKFTNTSISGDITLPSGANASLFDAACYCSGTVSAGGPGNSPPSGGTWAAGQRTFNLAPAVGSPKSWVCTVAGSPGTWVSEGNL